MNKKSTHSDEPQGRTVRYRWDEIPPVSEEDWKRMEAIRDEDIDFSDIPELTAADFRKARRPGAKLITIRLDGDVLNYFKSEGPGYQNRINRALRLYMQKERKPADPSVKLTRAMELIRQAQRELTK